ncbi:MAG: PRC-barrel domain-containing protein [Fidelibacterota bacterium]
MLRSINEIVGYSLDAEDGNIGKCWDFLFDDKFWTVRYMVADTGKWLPGRKVIISPISLGEPDWSAQAFPVRLTKKQIENTPGLDEAEPVSRQHEIRFFKYYGWPYYWGGAHVWGAVAFPGLLYDRKPVDSDSVDKESGDEHLRSAREVTGYYIQARDGEVGHVEDFILDDDAWIIRYLVVDTRNWLPGKKVLLAPDWIESIDWSCQKVVVDLTQEEIKASPEYDPKVPVNREYEERLYDFYGRPMYWV